MFSARVSLRPACPSPLRNAAGDLSAAREASPRPVQICTLIAAPLPPPLFAAETRMAEGMRTGKEGRSTSDRKTMKREELEALRARVSCEAVLERAGYEIDLKESTRRAVKYRCGGNIVIVTHDGRGWFDPLSDEKGDVFGLAMFLEGIPFPSAAEAVTCRVSTLPAGMEVLAVFRASQRHLRPLAQPAHAVAGIRCLALSVLGALDPDGHRPAGHSRGCPAGRTLRQYVGGPCR